MAPKTSKAAAACMSTPGGAMNRPPTMVDPWNCAVEETQLKRPG